MNKTKILSGLPNSYWTASVPATAYPKLHGENHADVVIVGGGMAGIVSAFLLTRAGLKTVVLEADRILHGVTGHTTGKLTSQHGLIYDRLVSTFGTELAAQYAGANEFAIRWVHETAAEYALDCDLSPQDAYVYTTKEENLFKLENEIQAARGLGLPAEFVSAIPFDIPAKGAVRFKDQAQFHPLKFLLPLAKEMVRQGGRIYEHSRVIEAETEGHIRVTTQNGGIVTADRMIIASHFPFINKEGMYFAKLHTERAYVLAVRAREKFPGGMYINAETPARSLRSLPVAEGELILVVGDEHKTGHGEDTSRHYERLMDFADRLFTVKDIPYRWSAQDCMTLDGLPYSGMFTQDSSSIYVATGFEKWGMTNSIASAHLIRDLILTGDSPWKDIYDPSRKTTAMSVGSFIVQNADVAGQFIGGKLAPLPSGFNIHPGEAQVVKIDEHRAGVYMDEAGELHVVDTTCTHLGCELNWNSAEKTWDCPCHGSRFTYTGDIVEGPALNPLYSGKDTRLLERLTTDKF